MTTCLTSQLSNFPFHFFDTSSRRVVLESTCFSGVIHFADMYSPVHIICVVLGKSAFLYSLVISFRLTLVSPSTQSTCILKKSFGKRTHSIHILVFVEDRVGLIPVFDKKKKTSSRDWYLNAHTVLSTWLRNVNRCGQRCDLSKKEYHHVRGWLASTSDTALRITFLL